MKDISNVLNEWVSDIQGEAPGQLVSPWVWELWEQLKRDQGSLATWLGSVLDADEEDFLVYEHVAQLEEMFDISIADYMVVGPLADFEKLLVESDNFQHALKEQQK